MSDLRFDGRVAVVTGAGRGIGAEEARLLAARGAKVVVNDWGRAPDGRDLAETPADDLVREITAAGGTAVADRSDVGTVQGCVAVVERALGEWGRVDIVVNNAGSFGMTDNPGTLREDQLDLVIRTHLLATIRVCRRAWPVFAEQGYGRIVNTSSAMMLGVDNTWDYPAAKGGIFGYTRALAVTGEPADIKANCIMPMAYTRTLHDYPREEIRAWMERTFTAAEVAPAVAYLAHEVVPCTGECFAVGGGRVGRVAMIASPGWTSADEPLTPEHVRDNFDAISDLSDARVLRTSKDESALYTGRAGSTS